MTHDELKALDSEIEVCARKAAALDGLYDEVEDETEETEALQSEWNESADALAARLKTIPWFQKLLATGVIDFR